MRHLEVILGFIRGCFGGDGSTRIQAAILIFGFLLRRLQNLQRIEKEIPSNLGLNQNLSAACTLSIKQ